MMANGSDNNNDKSLIPKRLFSFALCTDMEAMTSGEKHLFEKSRARNSRSCGLAFCLSILCLRELGG